MTKCAARGEKGVVRVEGYTTRIIVLITCTITQAHRRAKLLMLPFWEGFRALFGEKLSEHRTNTTGAGCIKC